MLSNYDEIASPLAEKIEKVMLGLPVEMPTQMDADNERDRFFEHAEQIAAVMKLFDIHSRSKHVHLPSFYASARLRILSKKEPEKAINALERYINAANGDTTQSVSAAWWRKRNA